MPSIVFTLLLLISVNAYAQQLAFPTAEGWGRFSTGGRGGIVCHVVNRNAGLTGSQIGGSTHYSGTLQYCASLNLTRTIVFDVSGTLDLHSQATESAAKVLLSNPNVTIAGQTSPGDGFLIRGGMVEVADHDVTIRHLRSRLGASNPQPGSMGPMFIKGTAVDDVILDHCSMSWGTDETLDISGGRDITVQRSFITEGVDATAGYGILIGYDIGNLSLVQNLIYLFKDRPPLIKSGLGLQLVNNYIINQGVHNHLWPQDGPFEVELIRNYYRNGPVGASPRPTIRTLGMGWTGVTQADHDASSFYVSGNIHNTLRPTDSGPEDDLVLHGADPVTRRTTPFGTLPEIESLQATADVPNFVLTTAGARVPELDAVDTRVINDVLANTRSSVPTNESQVGGFPTLANESRPGGFDTDFDGIPDAWETLCDGEIGSLSPSDGTDGNDIISGVHADVNGYSKLEVYLNELAGDYPLDSCGNQLSADSTAPTNVGMTSPSNAATVSGAAVNICSTADDETGMSRVEFYVDDNLAGTDTTEVSNEWCLTWDSASVGDGDRVIHSVAYDTSDNSTVSSDITVNVDNLVSYTVVHTSSAPTINGNLSEFSGANLIEFDAASGNTTDCKMMYDSTNLYLGCTTTDTNLTGATTANDDSSIFGEDSLELVLDPDNSNGSWTSSDYKLAINVQNARYDAHTQSNTAWTYGGSASVVLNGDVDSVADDTSWVVEASIPWSSMGVTPSTSATYAMNLQINDKDGTAATVRYRWNGTSANNLSDAMDVVLGEEVGGDTEDPTNVAITEPLDGAHIGGTYTLIGTATDNVAIQDLTFYLDTSTQICSPDTSAPFACDLDTTGLSETTHTLHVRARDTAGTPNETNSSTITVTVDNTPTSAPSGFTVTPSYLLNIYEMLLDWADVSGAVSYDIEKCAGSGCSDFSLVGTEPSSDYVDEGVPRNSEYCYRVRATDIAGNQSSYSSTVCELTLDAILLDAPSTLGDSAGSTPIFVGAPSTLSDTAGPNPILPGQPSTLSDTAGSTPIFLAQPTGLGKL